VPAPSRCRMGPGQQACRGPVNNGERTDQGPILLHGFVDRSVQSGIGGPWSGLDRAERAVASGTTTTPDLAYPGRTTPASCSARDRGTSPTRGPSMCLRPARARVVSVTSAWDARTRGARARRPVHPLPPPPCAGSPSSGLVE
jgi:hypothetical protein